MVDLSFNDIYIIITIIWGLSTFATNFMLLIVIRRARKNAFTPGAPSPFYIHPLQYLLIIVDCAYGMAASFNALDVSRLWFYPQAYTALSCLISIYPKLFTTIASLFIQLLLNVERICSTAWPLQYRYQGAIGNRSKALYCSACFAPAFLCSLLGFVGVNYGAKPTSCNPTVIRPAAFKNMLSFYICACGLAIAITCVILIIQIRRKLAKVFVLRTACMSTANPQPNFGPLNKQEAKATELTLALNFKCLLFDVVPNVVLTILTGSSLLTSGVAGQLVSFSYFCSVCSNFLIFIWKDKTILLVMKQFFYLH